MANNTPVLESLESEFPPVDPEIAEMMAAGVHRGHAISKHHPAMQPYLWGVRNGIDIIDLSKTQAKLRDALGFLKDLAGRGGLPLLVGTSPAAKRAVGELAKEFGCPVVTERWIGGTLTNFKVISKRIERLEELEREKASGAWEKFTKVEQLRLDEEIERLKRNFDGLRPLRRVPDALFIVSVAKDTAPLREARRIGIPIVALVDTNADPRPVSFPIPANDDARPAIEYMLRRMAEALREGQALASSGAEGEGVEPRAASAAEPPEAAAGGPDVRAAEVQPEKTP